MPELIKNDEDLVKEVKKIMEDAKPLWSALASCHLQHMIRSLKGDFV